MDGPVLNRVQRLAQPAQGLGAISGPDGGHDVAPGLGQEPLDFAARLGLGLHPGADVAAHRVQVGVRGQVALPLVHLGVGGGGDLDGRRGETLFHENGFRDALVDGHDRHGNTLQGREPSAPPAIHRLPEPNLIAGTR